MPCYASRVLTSVGQQSVEACLLLLNLTSSTFFLAHRLLFNHLSLPVPSPLVLPPNPRTFLNSTTTTTTTCSRNGTNAQKTGPVSQAPRSCTSSTTTSRLSRRRTRSRRCRAATSGTRRTSRLAFPASRTRPRSCSSRADKRKMRAKQTT